MGTREGGGGERPGRLLVYRPKVALADTTQWVHQVVRGSLRQRHQLPAVEGLAFLLQLGNAVLVPAR